MFSVSVVSVLLNLTASVCACMCLRQRQCSAKRLAVEPWQWQWHSGSGSVGVETRLQGQAFFTFRDAEHCRAGYRVASRWKAAASVGNRVPVQVHWMTQ